MCVINSRLINVCQYNDVDDVWPFVINLFNCTALKYTVLRLVSTYPRTFNG